jgi:hypothetical protein
VYSINTGLCHDIAEILLKVAFLYILCLFTGLLNKSITTDGTRGCELAHPSESVDNLLLSTQSLVFSSILPSVDVFFPPFYYFILLCLFFVCLFVFAVAVVLSVLFS